MTAVPTVLPPALTERHRAAEALLAICIRPACAPAPRPASKKRKKA